MATSVPVFGVRTLGDTRVIDFKLQDLTDAAMIKTAGDDIYGHIRNDKHPKVVVNFAGVERLSSATLGMLVALKKVVVEKKGGQLRLAGVADSLVPIFQMTQLDKVLGLCPTPEAAVASMK